MTQNLKEIRTRTKTRTQQDTNKNANNITKYEPETNYKEKKIKLDRIELVTRVKALIPDDVILTRSDRLIQVTEFWMTPLPEREDKSG